MRAILTYHSIDESGSPISIGEADFRRHIAWLDDRGPRIVSIEELLALPAGEPAVALTFDDAFVNFADRAWPVLRERRLPVTLYVPTAHAGGTNAWGGVAQPGIPELDILGWDQLARLAAEGLTLGSHTRTHPRLDQLPAAAARDELERSADEIADRTGRRPRSLAYPYGACSPDIAAVAREVYDHACTVDLRPLSAIEDLHLLPRIDAYYLRKQGMLEAWGTGAWKVYLRARAGARRCRSLLSLVRSA